MNEQSLVFGKNKGQQTYESSENVNIEFLPTMHGYKLTTITTEKKESLIAPLQRIVVKDTYFDTDMNQVAVFTNAQEWVAQRPLYV